MKIVRLALVCDFKGEGKFGPLPSNITVMLATLRWQVYNGAST